TPPQPAQGEAEVDLVRRTDTPLEGTAPAHRSTVPRTSAGAPADHMGAALLAALRCSLTGPPCLVPRPVHRPTTWELRSSLRCGARSPVHRASYFGRCTGRPHGSCAPRCAAVLAHGPTTGTHRTPPRGPAVRTSSSSGRRARDRPSAS